MQIYPHFAAKTECRLGQNELLLLRAFQGWLHRISGATSRFHHPHFLSESREPAKRGIKTLLDLLLAGLER